MTKTYTLTQQTSNSELYISGTDAIKVTWPPEDCDAEATRGTIDEDGDFAATVLQEAIYEPNRIGRAPILEIEKFHAPEDSTEPWDETFMAAYLEWLNELGCEA